MLRSLHIENLAVVETASLNFEPGLNVLTGSTGAGKSLILGAVNLLLGGKGSAELIRSGADRAEVTAVIVPDVDALPFEFRGLMTDGTLTVRREIRRNGRSHAWAADAPVTIRQLASICSLTMEPHGQNEQFLLKDPEHHVAYIDAAAGTEEEQGTYGAALEAYRTAGSDLARFETRMEELRQKKELLEHRIAELERANIVEGERDNLERDLAVMANAERIYQVLGVAIETLYDNDQSVVGSIGRVLRELEGVASVDPDLERVAQDVHTARLTLSDCVDTLRSYGERLEFDPTVMTLKQERLDQLIGLERRYGMPSDALSRQMAAWSGELDGLAFEGEARARLETAVETAAKAVSAAARALSKKRRAAARKLDTYMTGALATLMMKGASFRTDFSYQVSPKSPISIGREKPTLLENGIDVVRFMVRTNPGQAEGPVERVASTGEVSRIALALKELSSVGRPDATLIFDEIDAGIGADLGELIGEKLLALSQRFQIVCITHMPQVAARAGHHLVVIKESDDEKANVTVETVVADARRREIARMLGGAEGSEHRIALADELLRGKEPSKSSEARP